MRPETQLYFSALSIEEFREGDQLELEKHNGAKISQQVETRLRRKVSEKKQEVVGRKKWIQSLEEKSNNWTNRVVLFFTLGPFKGLKVFTTENRQE